MKLWTIQHVKAWEIIRDTGVLQVDPIFIEKDFVSAYNWLVNQMRERIGSPPNGCQYPIWAWTEKPDLRSSAHLPKGTQGVKIELELVEKDVLLMDFDQWNYLLNRSYFQQEQSWFDVFNMGDERQLTQAVFWELRNENVKRIQRFTAR